MIKKFIVKLVTNFQPRMNLGEKRFLEDKDAHEAASDYNKSIAMQHERERLKEQAQKREIPADEVILGPSDSMEKK
ncbi:MAG: hypothetical protein Q8Q89_05230 [bacterium]|nr:hypothetical protein [bacterium]